MLFLLGLVPVAALANCSRGRRILSKHGVTSLLMESKVDGEPCRIFAGTKRGALYDILWDEVGGHLVINSCLSAVDSKAFPVYSLDSSPQCVFCGCGDRHISVLTKPVETVSNAQYIRRLGPHTGWVKDLYFDSSRGLLFGIGCNCIETWQCTQTGDWRHLVKRSIKSSSKWGSALSSDLLCLCGDEENNLFYSGGVDGRIHVWSTDLAHTEPIRSISKHAGRVNGIVIDREADLMFSYGHDGKLQCWKRGPSLQETTAFWVGQDLRITAADCVRLSNNCLMLVIGCSNGALKQLNVEIDALGGITITEGEALSPLSTDCSINALVLLKNTNRLTLALVGHSKGLDLIDLDLDK